MKMGAAFLVGAMLAFDMGGPINKTAWFFCFSLLEKHIYDWYAIVGVVALMPPVAAGIATYLAPKLFTQQEKAAASSAIVVGCHCRHRTGNPLCAGRAATDDYRQYALRRHYRNAGHRPLESNASRRG
ncbi:putative fructose-like permease EIIC subunit 2 [Citrobacter freundii]|nr:putative fructose-like permease EIIC subunit 2 [Citrobacter freundii]